MPRVIGFCLLALLTGCGHTLTLMGDDGATGRGKAVGIGGKGTLEVTVNGRTYSGSWVAAQGGSVGFGTFGRGTFTTTNIDASSSGTALLSSTDGSTLRCRFVYGGMSGAGYGECLDGVGRHYELQIS